MFVLIVVTLANGSVELHICKAVNEETAYRIVGIPKESGQHTVLSPEQFASLSEVDGGYITKYL